MLKILAIGNSFSCDATAYLKEICSCGGISDVIIYNMAIGGCSLERHAKELKSGAYNYGLEINGHFARPAALGEEIKAYDWDIITLQQVSYECGIFESYQPYLDELVDFIKTHKPNAKIVWHKTWAYDSDVSHSGFALFDRDQNKMADCIDAASKKCADYLGVDMIPSGDVIRELRKLPEFSYPGEGQTLCRDGFHMHMFYGRYAVAATWFETLVGGDIRNNPFIPPVSHVKIITPEVMKKLDLIKETVHKVCSK